MYDDINNNEQENMNHYDTGSTYTHYDSSEAMNQGPAPKKRKKGGFGRTVAKCLVLALVFGSVSSAAFMGVNYVGNQYLGNSVKSQVSLSKAGNNLTTTTTASSASDVYDVSDIVTNCMPSVVSITNVGTQEFQTIFGNYEHAFSHTVPQFFGAVISTGIVCIGLLIFNWQMGLALLWVAPISFAIVILSRKCQEKLSKKHMNTRLELAEGIQECLETVQDIKACNQEEDYLRKLDAKMDAAEKAQISSEMTTASLLTTGQMFLRLGLATVIVVGNSLVVNGDTSLFTYILFLIAASRLYDPLSGAMANMAELFSVQLQVNRLKEIENYPEETGEKEIRTNGYDITFDHVRFSYEKGKPVLRDVSFTAKQGQVTALVGPSGGGKSTVAKLAAKFYPLDGGRILLGGTDIAPLNSTMLMKNYSIVFQDVVLFNNTIMENIRVGKKDATDEEVIAAAKAAQCDEFISKLPDGYQTVIGENGSTLSGGECQRLSIARALLKDAPVILLDEATASLDVDNETEIQNAISKLVKGKTVLIIAHRMRTVEAADNIIVLSDGVVAENGTHEELMKENGLYHRLVDLQTASANWKLSV